MAGGKRGGGGGAGFPALKLNATQILLGILLTIGTLFGVGVVFPGIYPALLGGPKRKGIKRLDDATNEEKKSDAATGAIGRQEEAEAPVTPRTSALEAKYESLGQQAVDAFRQAHFQEALEGFTEAMKVGEEMGNVAQQQRTLLSNRSACYEKLGRLDEALDDCAKILNEDYSNTKAKKRRERIIEHFLGNEQYQKALTELMLTFLIDMENFKRQRQWNPNVGAEQLVPPENLDEVAKKATRQLIDHLEATGQRKIPKVLPSSYTIKQVLQILPSYQTWRAKFAILRQAEQITADLKELDEAEGSDDATRLALLFERAITNMVESRFKRADDDLTAAMTLASIGISLPTDEEQAALHSWAGTFAHLKHELDVAKELLEKSCHLDSSKAEIFVKRACLHLDRSELDRARELFDEALSIEPSAFVYLWRCQLWMCGKVTEEDLKEAEKELRKCLEYDEENVVALARLMNIKMQASDNKAAEEAISKARRVAPRNADVVGAYAEFLLMEGKIDEAGRELEKAIRLDPSNPLPFINKALIAWQANDVKTARETLLHVIEMDPQYQPAYSFLANLEFKGSTTLEESKAAFEVIEKGISICKSKEDLEEMCQLKVLAMAKLDAAKRLGMGSPPMTG